MAGANDILKLIERRPLTIDEIVKETGCPKKSTSALLNVYLRYGTVGYFTAQEANFGRRTNGLPEGRPGGHISKTTAEIPDLSHQYNPPFVWLASDMLGTDNLYNLVGIGERTTRIAQFVKQLLRKDAKPGTAYWMDNLQDYVAKVILSERNRAALERFVTRDLELDLEELRTGIPN